MWSFHLNVNGGNPPCTIYEKRSKFAGRRRIFTVLDFDLKIVKKNDFVYLLHHKCDSKNVRCSSISILMEGKYESNTIF
ncbi:hypothetical protein MTBBW1_540027 [Desulfamplus magnetovallimortis]|uniref:Uncharacterized protein n=1 Tax=Desulfamplus magnetovallimortis TaxID=1246637 RepID=A0A1W1HI50_9BACT|nr:hypothetical protein MTBBW1_540027 [Desulfamplus magnetovallimortis]